MFINQKSHPRLVTFQFAKITRLFLLAYKYRDYHAEAAKIMADLPENFHIRKDYKKFKDFNATWFYDN
jgi:hypothetical protein